MPHPDMMGGKDDGTDHQSRRPNDFKEVVVRGG